MARLPIGQRIRNSRKDKGLTQSDLAEAIGISPSYLNLIEHDKRMIGGKLMKRIAEALHVEIGWLSGTEDARLAQDIVELTRSMAIDDLDDRNALNFVAQTPEWANAFLALHRRYQDVTETALALSDRLSQDPALMELSHSVLTQITSIRSFAEILEQYSDLSSDERNRFSSIIASQSDQLGSSARTMIDLLSSASETEKPTSPVNEVDDFIIHHGNYFPDLEWAAEALNKEMEYAPSTISAAIHERLTHKHGLIIRRTYDPVRQPSLVDEKTLIHAEGLKETTIRFREAQRLAELEMSDTLDSLVRDSRLTSDASRQAARRALANYAAGALLFPYQPFLDAAENDRYDIERLQPRFAGSFEQIAHRMVTLRRSGAEGVPFAFLRADPAGNISKPFSIPGLRMPRYGGACPLWAIYEALGTDRTIAQLASLSSGEQYLFVARRLTKQYGAFGTHPVTYSVMLGCDISYRDRLVYGDRFANRQSKLTTPVGFNCRSCPRKNCNQRAHAAILAPMNEKLASEMNT